MKISCECNKKFLSLHSQIFFVSPADSGFSGGFLACEADEKSGQQGGYVLAAYC